MIVVLFAFGLILLSLVHYINSCDFYRFCFSFYATISLMFVDVFCVSLVCVLFTGVLLFGDWCLLEFW